MSSTCYQYEPLTSESSFRVLRLLPAQRWIGQALPIEIELSEADLDSPPIFEAISYAWGQEEANAIVICDGRCLLVTPNVVSVLQALRLSDSSQVLWVDSICIDQSSVPERNMQVPRMRSIYRQATKVWVWLGEGWPEVNAAFDFLLEVAEVMKRAEPSGESMFHSLERPIGRLHAMIKETRGYYDPVDTDFIMDLLNLPWFRRTWTVQELALAREAIVLLGTRTIQWRSMVLALRRIQLYANSEFGKNRFHTSHSNPASFHDELKCYHRLEDLLHSHVGQSQTSHISTSLVLVRTKESSNPKDKVYGLYGIFDHMQVLRLPEVDYAQTVQYIYTNITRVAIEGEQSLAILHELCLPSRVPELPSWVPDWSNTDFVYPIDIMCAASKDSKVISEFCGLELAVGGIIIDELLHVAHSTSISTAGFRRGYVARRNDLGDTLKRQLATIELVRTLKAWVQCARRHKTNLTDRFPAKFPGEAFFGSMSRQKDSRGSASTIFDPKNAEFEDFTSIVMANEAGNDVDLQTLHDRVRSKTEYAAIRDDFVKVFGCSTCVEDWCDEMKIRLFLKVYSPALALLQHEVSLNTYHRTLFTTRDGYVGIGPRWAKTGDCVALVAGAQWPFVVRREGSKYRFIGPAKVHGIMQGERWDESKLERMAFV